MEDKVEITRHQAREVAVQMLYQMDINEEGLVRNLDKLHQERPELDLRGSFLSTILEGAYQQAEEVDQLVDENIDNWRMERIGKVERNIIRLAVYEMLHEPDIPVAVSIDEAVELAKDFNDQEAGKFVNGILGKLTTALDLEKEEESP